MSTPVNSDVRMSASALSLNDSQVELQGYEAPHARDDRELAERDALRYWARGSTGPQVGPPAYRTNPDAVDGAKRVMNAGSRWGADDYDARMTALAKELANGDASYREQLTAEIFKQDRRAMSSWLTPERANAMRYDGRLSPDQQGMVAESLAAAYNGGHIPQTEIGASPTPGIHGDGRVQFNELDQILAGYTSPGLVGHSDRVHRAQQVRQFLDFMRSSQGPETAEFRQKYAQHLIDEYVLDPAASFDNPTRPAAAAGLAANLLGGDLGNQQIAIDGLAKYDSKQLESIMEATARSNDLYGEKALQIPAGERQVDARSISIPDGAASLMLAVASTKSPGADKLAVELARMAASAPAVFEGRGDKDRIDALTLAVVNHHEPVLNALTDSDNTYIGDAKNTKLYQYMQNASDLGALFKVTLFNPDSFYSNLLQEKVVGYAGDLAQTINQPGANGDQVGRMAMLQASLTDGVRQGYEQLAADQEKQKGVLGFIIDLAVAALPISKWTSDGIKSVLTKTFGNNPRLQEALQKPIEQMFDVATGKLTEDGKKAILDSLGPQEGNLEVAKNAANQLNQSFMSQISPEDYDRKQVDTDYKVIPLGITAIREKK